MNITLMNDIFDLICDKKGSDYFTPEEKSQFINLASNSVVNDYYYNIKKKAQGQGVPQYSAEMNQIASEALWVLVESINTMTNDSGELTISTIEALTSNHTLMHIMSVSVPDADKPLAKVDDYVCCRYVRNNDFHKLQKNVFKKADANHPTFRYLGGKIIISPNAKVPVTVVVMRELNPVDIGTLISSELPGFMHNEIMMRALSFAGISIREPELAQATEQIKQQNG